MNTQLAASPPASSPFDFARLVRSCAMVSSAFVVGMLGTFLAFGIGQDPLQFFHSPAEYTEILLRNPPVLKLAIGLDNAFIMFYTTMFIALGAVLSRDRAPRLLVVCSVSLLALTGLLDLAENMHFLSMLATAQQGLPIGAGEIELQVWESLVKFHVSYLGLFVLGFALPAVNRQDKVLGFLFRWVQWPVGLLIYLTPATVATPLVLVRFSFFLVSFLLIAAIYRRREGGSDAPA